jgi:hypothetical protein
MAPFTTKLKGDNMVDKNLLKIGTVVRMHEFPENDVPEEDAVVFDEPQENGTLTIRVFPEFREDEDDDGFRDCTIEQVKEILDI